MGGDFFLHRVRFLAELMEGKKGDGAVIVKGLGWAGLGLGWIGLKRDGFVSVETSG